MSIWRPPQRLTDCHQKTSPRTWHTKRCLEQSPAPCAQQQPRGRRHVAGQPRRGRVSDRPSRLGWTFAFRIDLCVSDRPLRFGSTFTRPHGGTGGWCGEVSAKIAFVCPIHSHKQSCRALTISPQKKACVSKIISLFLIFSYAILLIFLQSIPTCGTITLSVLYFPLERFKPPSLDGQIASPLFLVYCLDVACCKSRWQLAQIALIAPLWQFARLMLHLFLAGVPRDGRKI